MSQGPNATLIGAPDARARLSTPCLLLEAEAFDHNLAAMTELVRRHGRELRPHVKAHKCTAIGRRQLEAGAVGLCCATVREAEVMAEAELEGILVTSPVIAPGMVERLVRARERVGLAVVVDSDAGIEALAAGASADRPLGAVVEIDVGQGRTGATRPEDAVRLARRIEALPQLSCRGIQAYYGHLQHVPAYRDRRARAAEQWARLQPFLDALGAEGLPPDMITGGGTGTSPRSRGGAVHRNSARIVPVHGQAVRRDRAGARRHHAVSHLAHHRRASDQCQPARPRSARCRL